MQRRLLPFLIIGSIAVSLFNWSCNKLDTTDIGSDLIPAVDNVHTFADTLNVITSQGVFNPDTTFVTRTDDNAVGKMNDPLFGQTTAKVFFQVKPPYFPYYLGNPYDTLNGFGCGLDSIVLCLKYKTFYGDSSQPLQLEVREVNDVAPYYFRDSVNKQENVNYQPPTGALLGATTVDVRRLADTIYYNNHAARKDYSVNTIRIKLDQNWANRLYAMDTIYFHPFSNAFFKDSIFRQFYQGLAVVPKTGGTGNELVYLNLADLDTKLEIHFRKRNNGFPVDTVINAFRINADYYGSPLYKSSKTANYIQRVRPALPSGDQEIYLQTSPGTYANLTIPGLSNLDNRIIHRAELIVQEIPDNSGFGGIYKAPGYLYMDLKDSGVNKWKPIYRDLNPGTPYDPDYKNPSAISYFPVNGIDYLYFGGFRRDRVDQFGNPLHYYNFNITRYVQDIVTNHIPVYPFRLWSPYSFTYPQYSNANISANNSVAYGRVRVGGGNNLNYKMRLRIIYSKL